MITVRTLQRETLSCPMIGNQCISFHGSYYKSQQFVQNLEFIKFRCVSLLQRYPEGTGSARIRNDYCPSVQMSEGIPSSQSPAVTREESTDFLQQSLSSVTVTTHLLENSFELCYRVYEVIITSKYFAWVISDFGHRPAALNTHRHSSFPSFWFRALRKLRKLSGSSSCNPDV